VYGEEVIAQRLLKCTKVINETLSTVDFLDEDGGVCFRTTSEESDKVIFQMGVSDPEVAAQAALMIEPHVAGKCFLRIHCKFDCASMMQVLSILLSMLSNSLWATSRIS
jgi:tRNA-dihydrouridine synthase